MLKRNITETLMEKVIYNKQFWKTIKSLVLDKSVVRDRINLTDKKKKQSNQQQQNFELSSFQTS